MSDRQLVGMSKQFAVYIIRLCENMKQRGRATAIVNQLLRCGTSIGANIHEANYASSRSDFINKFQIALKECYETDYWVDVFFEAEMLSSAEHHKAYSQCGRIRRMLVESIRTAKKGSQVGEE